MSELLRKELTFILKWSSLFSFVVLIIYTALSELNFSVFLGLMVGLLGMLVHFIMMCNSLEQAVRRFRAPAAETEKKRKGFVLGGYLLRYSIVGIIIAFSFLPGICDVWLDPICVTVPFFFPKIAYFINGLLGHTNKQQ